MCIQKGNAACHHYSKQGCTNYESMVWESSRVDSCKHRRSIGKKRVICILSKELKCPFPDNKCPARQQ